MPGCGADGTVARATATLDVRRAPPSRQRVVQQAAVMHHRHWKTKRERMSMTSYGGCSVDIV